MTCPSCAEPYAESSCHVSRSIFDVLVRSETAAIEYVGTTGVGFAERNAFRLLRCKLLKPSDRSPLHTDVPYWRIHFCAWLGRRSAMGDPATAPAIVTNAATADATDG